jgi:hypothetical protein
MLSHARNSRDKIAAKHLLNYSILNQNGSGERVRGRTQREIEKGLPWSPSLHNYHTLIVRLKGGGGREWLFLCSARSTRRDMKKRENIQKTKSPGCVS